MQLVKLHTTVQQRVDDVPKWSVQMYYTGALSTNCHVSGTAINKPSELDHA